MIDLVFGTHCTTLVMPKVNTSSCIWSKLYPRARVRGSGTWLIRSQGIMIGPVVKALVLHRGCEGSIIGLSVEATSVHLFVRVLGSEARSSIPHSAVRGSVFGLYGGAYVVSEFSLWSYIWISCCAPARVVGPSPVRSDSQVQ